MGVTSERRKNRDLDIENRCSLTQDTHTHARLSSGRRRSSRGNVAWGHTQRQVRLGDRCGGWLGYKQGGETECNKHPAAALRSHTFAEAPQCSDSSWPGTVDAGRGYGDALGAAIPATRRVRWTSAGARVVGAWRMACFLPMSVQMFSLGVSRNTRGPLNHESSIYHSYP
jgi:hypothetical protein